MCKCQFILIILLATVSIISSGQASITIKQIEADKIPDSQWQGKRAAYFGDSMTQKYSTDKNYWEYLAELLGIEPLVYGISGNQWNHVYDQALKLNRERGNEIDAIFIFAGTNDYNHSIPIGSFYSESTKETNHNGKMVYLKHRILVENDSTFCGRINKVIAFLKVNYPRQQVIIMTPIHRGYAKFSETNVQPEESFANEKGIYLDSYVNVLKEAASIWSVPLIDLYSLSGLYPMVDSNTIYFRNSDTDRLHPNEEGNYRLAKTIQYQLLALPSSFIKN